MIIEEIMNRDVKTIRPSENIQKAAEIMGRYRIGSLVVMGGDGSVVGLVTERDVLNKVVAQDRRPSEVNVEDIMTKELITITPETTLEDAADIMTKHQIKKLPVIKDDGLVGIVTASDLIAYENALIEKVASLLTVTRSQGIGG